MEPILEQIHSVDDVKQLPESQLAPLCDEIRECIIDTVSRNGGHLASNLGVVELTVALTRVFSPPKDSIVWDVGHQTYPYKILTGRFKEFSTIRQEGGLSGYPCRSESPCDHFSTGHSSTSISSALGISEANYLQHKDDYVVSVIGDGALTGGLAYEGLNNAGRLHRNFIVILNDNNRSISKNVGSLAKYLTHIRTRPSYIRSKKKVVTRLKKMSSPVGNSLTSGIRKIKKRIRNFLYPSNLFENFGFSYYGPFDGHNIGELVETLESAKMINKPVLIHVCTSKGKGYRYAEESPGIYHGPSSFDRRVGVSLNEDESFSKVFGQTLCELAQQHDEICAITAAMRDGTGLNAFRRQFKSRFYDVGIAEEHAVTFAGGLAERGMLPVFAVYSTFLQRAYDELIHDVALQELKIILAIDRAGVVGEDGKSHQGVFDTAYLQTIPNITVYSPSYYSDLKCQLKWLVEEGVGICALRYPRGNELFKPDYFRPSDNAYDLYGDATAPYALVTYGRLFSFAAQAMDLLKKEGIPIRLVKLNRIIPLADDMLNDLIDCSKIFFYEENLSVGGVGEHFSAQLLQKSFRGEFLLNAVQDPFIRHATMYRSLEALGFSAESIYEEIAANVSKSQAIRHSASV